LLERGEWITRGELHDLYRRRGVDDIRSKLEHLGGSIVYDYRDAGRDCYRLSFLGMLLTDDGPGVERLLAKHAAGRPLTAAETTRLKHVLEAAEWLRDPAVLASADLASRIAARAVDSYNPELSIDEVT
jgi:hypothetical protein